MLIVAGTIMVDPGHVEKLRAAVIDMVMATRGEEGCHEYVFSEALDDRGRIEIFEVWESADHLQAHFETEHMAEFQTALADLHIIDRDLKRYEVASSEPM